MRKAIRIVMFCVCVLALVLGLLACGTSNVDVAGNWASPNRSTHYESTYTNMQGVSVVLEENSTSDYKITFYNDGTYRATYSYENIKYDYNSSPAKRTVKTGTDYVNGTYTVSGNTVTMVDENGTTKLTYENGVLNSPKTSNYYYDRVG